MELPSGAKSISKPEFDYYKASAEFERGFIENALKQFCGNVAMTARKIGLSRRSLINKIEQYNINVEIYR